MFDLPLRPVLLVIVVPVSEYQETVKIGEREGTWDTVNKLTFNVTAADHRTRLGCVVEHEAIKDKLMRKDLFLNVLCKFNLTSFYNS